MRSTLLIATVLLIISIIPGICFGQNKVVVIPLGGDCSPGQTGAACFHHSDCQSGGCVNNICANFKLVFVTYASYNGDLGGLDGADDKCQTEADAAGLPGVYKAWLSSSTRGPNVRFTRFTGPYRRVDGEIVANDWSDLTDGTIANRIDVAANGVRRYYVQSVWTNTHYEGHPFYPENPEKSCLEWTTSEVGRQTILGWTDSANQDWTMYTFSQSCFYPRHPLFCFAQ